MWRMKSFFFVGSLLWTLSLAFAATTFAAVSVSPPSTTTTMMMMHRILQEGDPVVDPPQDDTVVEEPEPQTGAPADVGGTGGDPNTNEDTRVRTDLVRLLPFDLELAMTGDPEQVNMYSLKDIVQEWMSDSFAEKALDEGLIVGNSTTFNSLGLEVRTNEESGSGRRGRFLRRGGRQLQQVSVSVYAANYEGVTLWERVGSDTPPIDPEIVQLMQRATFLEKDALLTRLRSAEDFTGLGTDVADVRAYVVSVGEDTAASNNDDSSDPMEIVIIIAIVVACLAFGLLMFAVIWAWRTDQARRDYSNSKNGSTTKNAQNQRVIPHVSTQSESYDLDNRSPTGMSPPAVAIAASSKNNNSNDYSYNKKKSYATSTAIPPTTTTTTTAALASTMPNGDDYGGDSTDLSELPSPRDYDGSVISEDISTSLTAYYRSGMAGYAVPNGEGGGRRAAAASAAAAGDFNDNASMSSMDSYGYSLDGYAPSLGPAPQGYPVGSSLYNGLIKDPDTDYSEEEEAEDYSNMNNNTDTEEEDV